MALTGVLVQVAGWPMAFYSFGAAAVVWFLPWLYFVYSSPQEHPGISQKEKDYIADGRSWVEYSTKVMNAENRRNDMVLIPVRMSPFSLPGIAARSVGQHSHFPSRLGVHPVRYELRVDQLHDAVRSSHLLEERPTFRRPAGCKSIQLLCSM